MRSRGDSLIGIDADFELVRARLANLDKAVGNDANKEWREAGKAAAEVVRAEWERRAPRRSGGFIRGGQTGYEMRRGAYVNVTTSARAPDYASVVEFGGTIPVPHSKTNPKLKGRRRMASKDKPWIGGRGGTSYYLYPAKDDKLQEAADVYVAGVQKIVDEYLPNTGGY